MNRIGCIILIQRKAGEGKGTKRERERGVAACDVHATLPTTVTFVEFIFVFILILILICLNGNAFDFRCSNGRTRNAFCVAMLVRFFFCFFFFIWFNFVHCMRLIYIRVCSKIVISKILFYGKHSLQVATKEFILGYIKKKKLIQKRINVFHVRF